MTLSDHPPRQYLPRKAGKPETTPERGSPTMDDHRPEIDRRRISQGGESTDFLTGFFLRGAFSSHFRREFRQSSARVAPLSIILMDIDHFKTVNDGFGHTRGDAVLRELASRLRSSVRSTDLVFRYGGDEFVILLPGTPMEGASKFAGSILTEVSGMKFRGDPDLSLSVSIGVASYPADGSMPEEIFEKADARLYAAKRHGRGRMCCSDEGEETAEEHGSDGARLLERDEELSTVMAFLQEIGDGRTGSLVITGPPRSGKRSFSARVSELAAVAGLHVIEMESSSIDYAIEKLDRLGRESGGVMLVLQNANRFSAEELAALRNRIRLMEVTVASLLVTDDLGADGWGFVSAFAVSEVIHLGPISMAGTRIWLRSALGMEASREFVGWFYSETGGIAGNFQPAVNYMKRRGYLKKEGGRLVPGEDYWEFDLSRCLSFDPGFHVRNTPTGFSTEFIGRKVVSASIVENIRSGLSVSLTGPGGAGKTRLAVHVASSLDDEFRNGVCFVDLSGIEDPGGLLASLGSSLDLRFEDEGNRLGQMKRFLSEKEMLIVLDGFETMTGAGPTMNALREDAPAISFLFTSRVRTDLEWVEEMDISGLPVPSSDFENYGNDSVELFLQVARRVKPGFSPDHRELDDIAAICRTVDGLPLALELAASQVSQSRCSEIRARVEADTLSLSSEQENVPARHRSMAAVMRQSWNLVPDDQKTTLMRLSVFKGVFTPEAAAAVAGADSAILSQLQHRWMVRRTARGRYLIPRMIHGFLRHELDSMPEQFEDASDAHCMFFAGYLSQLEESLFSMVDWSVNRREIDSSLEDIVRAWEWALDRGYPDCLRMLTKPLILYFRSRGILEIGAGLMREGSERIPQLEGMDVSEKLALQAVVDVSLGLMLFLLGAGEDWPVLLESSAVSAEASGDTWTRAYVASCTGFIQYRRGDYALAEELLSTSSELFLESGSRCDHLQARSDLGITLLSMGRMEEAMEIISGTLEECRSQGFIRGEFTCLKYAGHAASALGDFDEARECFMKYLAYTRKNGLTFEIGKTLNDLAGVAASAGDMDESEKLYRQALKVFRDLGNRSGQAGVDFNLGIIAQMKDRQDVAEEHYRRTLEYAGHCGETYLEVGGHTGLSFVHGSRGEHGRALQHLLDAYDISQRAGARQQALRAMFGMAKILLEAGLDEHAAELAYVCMADPAGDNETTGFLEKLFEDLSDHLDPEALTRAEKTAAEVGEALVEKVRSGELFPMGDGTTV